MNTMAHPHPVRLRAPFYAQAQGVHTQQQGAELHRYFEPEFTNLFQQDLQQQRLGDAENYQWKIDDNFSRFKDYPVLRLPMHKSFYLVSCEVVCDRPGRPALDPQQITSAGYVIRRLAPAGEQSWMLENDKALGWHPTPTGLRDPDVNRRCCQPGGKAKVKLRGAAPPPVALTYTGEQTHPMHAIKTYDHQGKCHTIIFGYIALGGSYMLHQSLGKAAAKKSATTQAAAAFTADSLANFSQTTAAQLPWPFGFKPEAGKVDQTWKEDCARPINKSVPSPAFFELLKHLVNRYHLGEKQVDDNAALQAWAEKQHFYVETAGNKLSPASFTDFTRGNFTPVNNPENLYAWLGEKFAQPENPLVNYIATQEKRLDEGKSLEPIPGLGDYSLYITPADAQDLRNHLDQRVLGQVVGKVKEIPLPKFGQDSADVFQIVPFIRLRNACGGEEIVWGDAQLRSEKFRVAAPFDPNASRPSLIQMPSLADLRKGMAQGVSMVTPPDTFSLLNALNLKKGASEDVIPGNVPQLGIQWICSFSLPVITLVAMILLMIMISLLNIIFFWLPWVRICLPFPSIKKE